jgi:hypothetical protein
MILETEAPVDEATDHGDEEPGPEGEVEIADGAAEIEGQPGKRCTSRYGDAQDRTLSGRGERKRSKEAA